MDTRPNIILIITDQQRYDTIRALGFPYMDTPVLDRLTQEGVAFTNAFVTASFWLSNGPCTIRLSSLEAPGATHLR
jgi:succinylarginine dihydrolase